MLFLISSHLSVCVRVLTCLRLPVRVRTQTGREHDMQAQTGWKRVKYPA